MIFFWLLFRVWHQPVGEVMGEIGDAVARGIGEGMARGFEEMVFFAQVALVAMIAVPLVFAVHEVLVRLSRRRPA